jgi:hypothetical protein
MAPIARQPADVSHARRMICGTALTAAGDAIARAAERTATTIEVFMVVEERVGRQRWRPGTGLARTG